MRGAGHTGPGAYFSQQYEGQIFCFCELCFDFKNRDVAVVKKKEQRCS